MDFEDDNVDSAADELLKRWNKPTEEDNAPKPEADPDPEPSEQNTVENEDDEDITIDTSEDTPEEVDEGDGTLASDDHFVELEPGKRLKVSELKAIAAREAEIASKHEEVAAASAKATEEAQRHSTALNALLDRAKQRWEPYSKVDYLLAQKTLTDEEFATLRSQAQAAYQDVEFFEAELGKAVETQQQSMVEAAKECVKVLLDPEKGIKGWGAEMYNDLRSYATESGISRQVFDHLTDPAAFKILHKARLYDKARKSAMKKVVTAPKNVNKTQTGGVSTPGSGKVRSAMEALRKSGDTDDAAAALLARWS